MRTLMLFSLLVCSPLCQAAGFGAPLPDGEVVGIAQAAADPAAHAGHAAKFTGRITQVCQKKGCWVVLEQDGHTARVMAKDEAFAVPSDAKGSAIAYGLLQIEPISAEHARHLVQDDGAQAPAARELRIVATGIQLLE